MVGAKKEPTWRRAASETDSLKGSSGASLAASQ